MGWGDAVAILRASALFLIDCGRRGGQVGSSHLLGADESPALLPVHSVPAQRRPDSVDRVGVFPAPP